MNELGKRLGRRIYGFRKQQGLTQGELAEKAKISNEFMSALERGAKSPSLQVLEQIAKGLRVDLKDLFNFDETGYRKLEPFSRKALDIASRLQRLPAEQRQRVLRILNTLLG